MSSERRNLLLGRARPRSVDWKSPASDGAARVAVGLDSTGDIETLPGQGEEQILEAGLLDGEAPDRDAGVHERGHEVLGFRGP
jgi:hypothetical protein